MSDINEHLRKKYATDERFRELRRKAALDWRDKVKDDPIFKDKEAKRQKLFRLNHPEKKDENKLYMREYMRKRNKISQENYRK